MTEKRTRQDLNSSVESVAGSRQDLKNAGRSTVHDQVGKSINVFNNTPGVKNPFLNNNSPSQAGQSAQNSSAQNSSQAQGQSEALKTLQGTKSSEK